MKKQSILIVLLVSLFVYSCASKNTLAPTEGAAATASSAEALPTVTVHVSTAPIAGHWVGNFQGISDGFSAPIRVTLFEDCEMNAVCGTYSVPLLPCSGELILTEADTTTFTFTEQRTGGADWCGSGGLEHMELLPDQTLSWGYSDPGASIKSKGILIKVARDGETVPTSTAVLSKENISQLKEMAIWGRGAIRSVQWSQDGGQIFVDTALSRNVYDSTTLQFREEFFIYGSDTPMLTFDVEDLGATADSQGRLRHPFKINVIGSDGSPAGSFETESMYPPQVRYLPESNMIAIDNLMGGLGLHDGTTYEVICSISGSWESPVTVTPDRKTVATGGMDGYITLKSGDGFRDEVKFETGGPVRFLSFSPDGKQLAAETNGTVSIWDISSGKVSGALPEPFLAGNFFNDPFYGGSDATVGLTVKDSRIAIINKNRVILRSLLDGKQSGLINGYEGTRLDNEIEKGGEVWTYASLYQDFSAVFFTQDNQELVTTLFNRAHVWDLATGQFVRMIALLPEQDANFTSAYSPSQNVLLTGSYNKTSIKSWNVEDGVQGESIRAWNASGLQNGYDGTHSLTMSPDGRYVFSWSGLEGVANLWEIETRQKVMTLSIPRSEYSQYKPGFYPVALSPDNTKLVFSYSLQPDLHLSSVYSIPEGAELYQISNYHAAFSPDGSMIAASVGEERIRFYDAETGATIGEVASQYPNRYGFHLLYFSEDGKSLIAVSRNGTISIWGIP